MSGSGDEEAIPSEVKGAATGMRRLQRPSSLNTTVGIEEPIVMPQRRRRQGNNNTATVLIMIGFIFVVGLTWWGLMSAVLGGEHAKHTRVRPTADAKEIIESTDGLTWDRTYERHAHQTGWVLETQGDLFNVGFPDGTSKWYPSHAVAKVGEHSNIPPFKRRQRIHDTDSDADADSEDEPKPHRDRRKKHAASKRWHHHDNEDNDHLIKRHHSDDEEEHETKKPHPRPHLTTEESADIKVKSNSDDDTFTDQSNTKEGREGEEEEEAQTPSPHTKKPKSKRPKKHKSPPAGDNDEQLFDNTNSGGGTHKAIRNLDLTTNRPKHREACQYPALHDHKWKEKFGWGVKKEFTSCRVDDAPFAIVSYPYVGEGGDDDSPPETFTLSSGHEFSFSSSERQVTTPEYGTITRATFVRHSSTSYSLRLNDITESDNKDITITVDDFTNLQHLKTSLTRCGVPHHIPKLATVTMTDCPDPKVIGFNELTDSYFTKMHTTLDAEKRQNHLKAAFSDPSKLDSSHTYKKADGSTFPHITEPYIVAYCNPRKYELFLNMDSSPWVGEKPPGHKTKLNVAHVMFDSTSLAALIRACPKTIKKLEAIDSDPKSPSRVFSFKHLHAVSCCSPGNQIPMYSGHMNGEGSPFVLAEPNQQSKNWLWNIAKHHDYNTYFSLDNCPDKSARDFQAWPSVDHRVVAPMCMAGILLSHKDRTCLGQETIDYYVFDSLTKFWDMYPQSPKYAAAQLITPHEETEKLLIELDDPMTNYLTHLEETGALNNTAVVFFSDHGINFGRYAATHDGEIDKMFPFVHVILPKWLDGAFDFEVLRENEDALITPYDVHQLMRELIAYPDPVPPFAIDEDDPPLPKPEHSHIVASMKKLKKFEKIGHHAVREDRACTDANIPPEFCTCVGWVSVPDWKSRFQQQVDAVVESHQSILSDLTQCQPIELTSVESVDIQVWPTEYHPKEHPKSKKIWMAPNRDMLRIQYKATGGLFEAILSLTKGKYETFDVSLLTRIDAMKSKCGVTEKKAEILCVCKEEEEGS